MIYRARFCATTKIGTVGLVAFIRIDCVLVLH